MGKDRTEICFVHGGGYEAFKNSSVGGTQLQLYFISTALAEDEDYDVKFITKVSEKKSLQGVELVPGIGKTNSLVNEVFTGLKLTYRLFREDPDIYFSSNSNIDVFLIGLVSFIKNKKHFHRTVHERQISKEELRKRPFRGFLNHIGMRQADVIFTQSRDHYGKLSAWFDPDLEILPNSFPINSEPSIGGNYILWVARRVRWKRPDLVLDLAEDFKSEEFIVISPKKNGSQDYYERIEERAEELGNVTLIDRVPRNEIQVYFDDAKIFVNTSESEGFPNTFVEAGGSGTPILSYKVNPDSFIKSRKCGFSCKGSYNELKQRLEFLLENDDTRRIMGKNCFEYVKDKHSLSENISIIKNRIGS